MIYTCHRINTIDELKNIPGEYGVEIDIRDQNGELILHHEPYKDGDLFKDFIKLFKHRYIILNIKCEQIEEEVLKIINENNIENFFLLDSSFPMIYKYSEITKNIAVRYSEYESIENVLLMRDKVSWVWVDSFNYFSLNFMDYFLMKENGFKVCIVSPELQNQDEKIEIYGKYMLKNNIIPDMICTKKYNINRWQEMFK